LLASLSQRERRPRETRTQRASLVAREAVVDNPDAAVAVLADVEAAAMLSSVRRVLRVFHSPTSSH
jgi:hypothetical protein